MIKTDVSVSSCITEPLLIYEKNVLVFLCIHYDVSFEKYCLIHPDMRGAWISYI